MGHSALSVRPTSALAISMIPMRRLWDRIKYGMLMGRHITLPCGCKTRRLSNATARENTTKCRPCHGSDAFDSNNYCFHFTLASVSESELLQVSLECSQCRSVGMSRAVLISISRSAKCDFLAVDMSPFLHNLTLHSLNHLIVSRYLVKSGRCAFQAVPLSPGQQISQPIICVYLDPFS